MKDAKVFGSKNGRLVLQYRGFPDGFFHLTQRFEPPAPLFFVREAGRHGSRSTRNSVRAFSSQPANLPFQFQLRSRRFRSFVARACVARLSASFVLLPLTDCSLGCSCSAVGGGVETGVRRHQTFRVTSTALYLYTVGTDRTTVHGLRSHGFSGIKRDLPGPSAKVVRTAPSLTRRGTCGSASASVGWGLTSYHPGPERW